MRKFSIFAPLTALLCGACGAVADAEDPSLQRQAIVAGAGFTTFDAAIGGCLDSKNGVNCNSYAAKEDAYVNATALSDGTYVFSVIAPGTQADAWQGGAALSSDGADARTFAIAGGQVTYAGPHAQGSSPQGKAIIGLAPYADTPNDGGVYVVAICKTSATSSADCKYDAFKAPPSSGGPPTVGGGGFPTVSGGTYYDANANGAWDPGEPGIPGWKVDYHDGVSDTVTMGADGRFTLTLIPDTYTFSAERSLTGTWMPSGTQSYDVTLGSGQDVTGIDFGEVCLGFGNGRTLGFWSNKNGQALLGASDLAFLSSLNLRVATGAAFDPTTYTQLRNWLLNGTATYMPYMLSVQLATMELNVRKGFVGASRLVWAPPLGFVTVSALMDAANTELAAAASDRSYQEALKTALDRANNDLSFVQASPAQCATPTF